jgi:hypothetical protein
MISTAYLWLETDRDASKKLKSTKGSKASLLERQLFGDLSRWRGWLVSEQFHGGRGGRDPRKKNFPALTEGNTRLPLL